MSGRIPLRVTRIADQDPTFLRFIESNDLKPGQAIEVELRDPRRLRAAPRGAQDDHDRHPRRVEAPGRNRPRLSPKLFQPKFSFSCNLVRNFVW